MSKKQQEVIEELLSSGDWVEMPQFIQRFITKGATIISNMRRKQGWVIESERVPGKPYQRYRLISKPKEFGFTERKLQQPTAFRSYDETSHLKPNGRRK